MPQIYDYSKFKLKSDEEIGQIIKDKDNLVVLSCNKCFKVFTSDSLPEPETGRFLQIASRFNKNILAIHKVDFLCNEYRLISNAPLFSGLGNFASSGCPPVIIVIACGTGTQTVCGLPDIIKQPELVSEIESRLDIISAIPVYTVCDSVLTGAGHGLVLEDKRCRACARCFLTHTGGICPVTGCAKSLLNGPCGGSRLGMCEADNNLPCAWDKISTEHLLNPTPLIYNHNMVSGTDTARLSVSARRKRLEGFYGGIYLKYCKDSTAFLTLENFPLPARVHIPMLQHIGKSAEPIVGLGDYVTVGQKIGNAVGAVSSSVHASISGTVTKIAYRSHLNLSEDVITLTIESDGNDTPYKTTPPVYDLNDADIFDIDAIIADKGIVGMGGACFPTPVKTNSPRHIDTILINGCECEPYITADHRVMLEYPDEIITGLKAVMKSTGAAQGIIVITDNKTDAITKLKAKTADIDGISVKELKSKYPQGAERMMIATVLGRYLNYGQLPFDAGVIVINVSTAKAIGDAFLYNKPLIERAVTVSGDAVSRPGNYLMRIGTPVSDILKYCGYNSGSQATVRLGGPMMGVIADDYNIPVLKGTNAIICNAEPVLSSRDCIRCGRCVDVCPMQLLPLYFPLIAGEKNTADITGNSSEKNAKNCIECGACDFICPSNIKLRQSIRKCKDSMEKV